MYIKDGIAYANESTPILSMLSVRPLDGHKLRVKFNDETQRIVDMTPLLDSYAFIPLRDKAIFDQVYIEFGVPLWCEGEIDIAPEWLQENGWPIEQGA